MDSLILLTQKREQIMKTAADYDAYDVRVFGSVARGEADEASEINLLVSLEPGRSLMDLGGLLYDLQKYLGIELDVVPEKGLRARISEQVLREAIPL
jgi:predicted nucleotidyltransferase